MTVQGGMGRSAVGEPSPEEAPQRTSVQPKTYKKPFAIRPTPTTKNKSYIQTTPSQHGHVAPAHAMACTINSHLFNYNYSTCFFLVHYVSKIYML